MLEAFRATGGTAPGEVVGRLLEDHHAGQAVSLAKLVYSGQVFGFEWRANLWIPMFQFEAVDLAIRTDVQAVRAALPGPWSGWRLAAWFATANARLEGRCPADLLDWDLPAVMRAADLALADEAACSGDGRPSQQADRKPAEHVVFRHAAVQERVGELLSTP